MIRQHDWNSWLTEQGTKLSPEGRAAVRQLALTTAARSGAEWTASAMSQPGATSLTQGFNRLHRDDAGDNDWSDEEPPAWYIEHYEAEAQAQFAEDERLARKYVSHLRKVDWWEFDRLIDAARTDLAARKALAELEKRNRAAHAEKIRRAILEELHAARTSAQQVTRTRQCSRCSRGHRTSHVSIPKRSATDGGGGDGEGGDGDGKVPRFGGITIAVVHGGQA